MTERGWAGRYTAGGTGWEWNICDTRGNIGGKLSTRQTTLLQMRSDSAQPRGKYQRRPVRRSGPTSGFELLGRRARPRARRGRMRGRCGVWGTYICASRWWRRGVKRARGSNPCRRQQAKTMIYVPPVPASGHSRLALSIASILIEFCCVGYLAVLFFCCKTMRIFSRSPLVVAQQRRRTLRWLSRRFVHGFLRLSDISSASLRRRDVYQDMARATADGDPLLPLVLMLPTHSSAACKQSHPYSDTSAQCCPRRPSRYLH